MSAGLPVDGVMTAATRSIVRSFQRRENLPVSGIVGPDTEDALKRACGGVTSSPAGADAQPDQEWGFEVARGVGSTSGRGPGALGGASGARIIDLTAQADKSRRKGTRDPRKVYALVLHQMACCFKPTDPLKRFLSFGAHFAILADGRILQLHPVSALLWASNGFNPGSVAVEFAGNFPNINGKWWEGDRFGRNRPTPAQLDAGRYLVRHLIKTIGLTHVLAHRQSSHTRDNDPGPEIWYHVGQWAVERLGLKDGGPGYKHPTGGKPIPDQWRNWGRAGGAREVQELWEAELFETETAAELWKGEPEGPWNAESPALSRPKLFPLTFDAAISSQWANAPGIYTIYRCGKKSGDDCISSGGVRLYVGKSENLSRRLMQHKWCLTHMDVDPSNYQSN